MKKKTGIISRVIHFIEEKVTEEILQLIILFIIIGLGYAAKNYLKDPSNLLFAIFGVVSVLYLTYSVKNTHYRIEYGIEHLLGNLSKIAKISVNFFHNTNKGDIAYIQSLKVVQSAKSRIHIVSDYSPVDEPIDFSDERNEYLKAIEQLIETKIIKNETFDYIRIVQRDKELFNIIKNKKGKIDDPLLTEADNQVFEHCKRILNELKPLKISRKAHNVKIRIYVCKFVATLPSFLIVDNEHLLLTFTKKNKDDLSTAGTIHFTDKENGKAIIHGFEDIFNSIKSDINDIIEVESINFQEPV